MTVPGLAGRVRARTFVAASHTADSTSPSGSAEQELLRLAGVVNCSNDAILTVTLDGVITSWNPAATRLYGYEAAEAVGQTIALIAPPDRMPETRAILGRIAAGESIPTLETTRRRRDGQSVDVSLTASPICDASGCVLGASLIARDVSMARRLASDLLVERARLDAVLEQMPGAVVIAEAPSGRVVRCNRQVEQVLRHSLTPAPDLGASRDLRGFHPDGSAVRADEWPLARAVSTGETVVGEEIEYLRGDGTLGWIAVNAAPIRDSDGQIVAAVSTFYDVDAQKRAEEQVRVHARRTQFLADLSRALAEAHLDMPALVDIIVTRTAISLGDGVVLRLVPDGGQSLEPAGSYHRHPQRATALREAFAAGPQGIGEGLQGQAAMQRRLLRVPRARHPGEDSTDRLSGHAYLEAMSLAGAMVTPLCTRDRVIGTLLVVRDAGSQPFEDQDERFLQEVSDRAALALENARLYRALQDAVQVRDEFLSIASHELRTPITAIKASAQLMRRSHDRGTLDTDRFERSLRSLEEGSNRLSVLTEDLLDVSRLQTGRLRVHLTPVDMVALVRRLTAAHAAQLPAGQELRLEVVAPSTVMADETRVEQVIGNLLSNASKYSPGGGTICVTVDRSGDGCLVRIQDQGIGLPSESGEQIFEPFGRARNATEHNLPGMGLGLYISRQIVERHSGKIWAESDGEQRGTCISVWLPTHQAETAETPV